MENKVFSICSEVHLHHLFMRFELMNLPYVVLPKQMPERLSPVTIRLAQRCTVCWDVLYSVLIQVHRTQWSSMGGKRILPCLDGSSGIFWIHDNCEDGIWSHFAQQKQLCSLLNTNFYIFQARRHILKTAVNGKLILLYSSVTDLVSWVYKSNQLVFSFFKVQSCPSFWLWWAF